MKHLKALSRKLLSDLFSKTKADILGPKYMNKALIFSYKNYNPSNTLVSAYAHALSQSAPAVNSFDKATADKLLSVANGYFDSLQEKVQTEINSAIDSNLHEVEMKRKLAGVSSQQFLGSKEGKEIQMRVAGSIRSAIDKADVGIEKIVVDQIHTAQNLGAMDGIIGMSKALGISDPNIFKIGVLDDNRCKICWKLWTLEDKSTPRVYKMSELKGGYCNHKAPEATIGPSHPNCFTEGKTPVLTQSGWQPLKEIKIGDMVLTHTGTFKPVIGVINEPYRYKKMIKITYTYTGKPFSLRVTPDHKFLTNRGWVEARDMTLDDKLVSLNYPCAICNNPIKITNPYKFKMPATCSKECQSSYGSDITTKYHSSLTDAEKKSRAANCSSGVIESYKKNNYSVFNQGYWTPERRNEQRKALLSRLPEMMKKSASTRVSKKQMYVFSWIQDFFVNKDVQLEFPVGNYSIDIALTDDKIAVEIDGKYHSGDRLLADSKRDEELKRLGWTVMRYGFNRSSDINKQRVIEDVQRVLNNHDKVYSFGECQITSITEGETGNGRVYCLTVAGDESFITRGVVSHNCRDILTTILPGFGFDGSGNVTYKGKFADGTPWDEYEHQRSGKI